LQALDAILFAIQTGDVHQGGDGFFGTGGLADHMQPTGQQARLNLHQLDVDFAHQIIPFFGGHLGGIQKAGLPRSVTTWLRQFGTSLSRLQTRAVSTMALTICTARPLSLLPW
jgi:hypothetical protein